MRQDPQEDNESAFYLFYMIDMGPTHVLLSLDIISNIMTSRCEIFHAPKATEVCWIINRRALNSRNLGTGIIWCRTRFIISYQPVQVPQEYTDIGSEQNYHPDENSLSRVTITL